MGSSECLRRVMDMEGHTQSTLASVLGCNRQDVNRYMVQGDNKCSTLARLLSAMGWELVACRREDVPEGALRIGGAR